MICASCGFEFNDQLSFCPRCAASVSGVSQNDAAQAAVWTPPSRPEFSLHTQSGDLSARPMPGAPIAKPVNGVGQPGGSTVEPNTSNLDNFAAITKKHAEDAGKRFIEFTSDAKRHAEAAGEQLSELASEAKHRAETAGEQLSGLASEAKHHAETAGEQLSGLASEVKRNAETAGKHLSELAADAKSRLDAAGGIPGVTQTAKNSFLSFIEKSKNYSADMIEKLDENRNSPQFWLYTGGITSLLILAIILTIR